MGNNLGGQVIKQGINPDGIEYRIFHGYGRFFNLELQVQEYTPYGWQTDFHSDRMDLALEAFNRRIENHKKQYKYAIAMDELLPF